MADYVQQRCLVFVPFWKFISDEDLIPNNELMKIIRKANDLEEGIQKHMKGLDDFEKLIDFFLNLQDELSQATKAQQKTHLDKKINEVLTGSISSRFGIALRTLSMNMKLWDYWIKVYLKIGWYDSITKIYEEYARTLGQCDPTLWIQGGLYPLRRRRAAGIQEARAIMQSCLRRHPADPNVFLGLLSIELMCQDFLNIKMAKEGKDEHSSVALAELATSEECFRVCYEQAISTSVGSNPSFYIEVYKLLNKYPSTNSGLKATVLNDMEKNCQGSEETYEFLADLALEAEGGVPEWGNIINCFKVYENGTDKVSTRKMYNRYLSAHARVLRNIENPKEKRDVTENMMEVCKRAHELKFLTRQDYMDWFLMVKQLEENYKKSKSAAELDVDLIPYEEWIKREVEKQLPVDKKLRKSDEQDDENEELQRLFANVEEVIDAALVAFPNDAEFVEYKINCILFDPVNQHLYYGSLRATDALKYLKSLGNIDGDSFPIYRKIYLYCTKCYDCEQQTHKLIKMAPQAEDIQLRLVQEYLPFIFAKEMGYGKKVKKFLKGLQKANQKPLDVNITRLTEVLQNIFKSPSDSEDSDG